jgi:hypothetical protein
MSPLDAGVPYPVDPISSILCSNVTVPLGRAAMAEEQGELAIEIIGDPQADDEELAELTYRLRDELLTLDVETAEQDASSPAPADAKGVGFLAIGGLIVRLVLSPDGLKSVVSGVRSWASRQHLSSVKLTLDGDTCEVTGRSSAEMERLIDLWIERHADRG